MRIRLPGISTPIIIMVGLAIFGALGFFGYQSRPTGLSLYGGAGEYYVPEAGSEPADGPVQLLSVAERLETTPHSLILHVGGSEIETLEWTGLNLGAPSGITNALLITADVGAGAYNVFETFHMTADCPTLTITDSEFGHMTIENITHDGAGFEMIQTADVATISFGSTRGFTELVGVLDNNFDKIELSGDAIGARIKTFHLDVKSRNACLIGRVKAGTFRYASGKVGEGDGLANQDLIIQSSVKFNGGGVGANTEIQTDVR
jgi:hypothetical protein